MASLEKKAAQPMRMQDFQSQQNLMFLKRDTMLTKHYLFLFPVEGHGELPFLYFP